MFISVVFLHITSLTSNSSYITLVNTLPITNVNKNAKKLIDINPNDDNVTNKATIIYSIFNTFSIIIFLNVRKSYNHPRNPVNFPSFFLLKNVKYNTNLQGIISQKGIVVQDIEPYEVGVVKLNGEEWSAISKDKVKIKKGSIVEVVQIEGVKLIVKEVSNINLDLENNKKNKDSISREIDIKIKTSK